MILILYLIYIHISLSTFQHRLIRTIGSVLKEDEEDQKKEDSLVDTEVTYYVPIPNAYINPNTNKPCINYRFKT